MILTPGSQLWSLNYELGLHRQAMKPQALEFLPIPPSSEDSRRKRSWQAEGYTPTEKEMINVR